MFKIGEEYIVRVTDDGLKIVDRFDSDRYVDIEHDDIDVLTNDEKEKIIEDYKKEILIYLKVSKPNWIDAYNHINHYMTEANEGIVAQWNELTCSYDTEIQCSRCGWHEKFVGTYPKFCHCCNATMIPWAIDI